MSEQIIALAEIEASARHCWNTDSPCPYIPGTAAHNEWVRAYARCAADALQAALEAGAATSPQES